MVDDERVTCTTCQWLRGGWCQQAKSAGMSQRASIEIGPDLAELPQRCPAHKPKNETKGPK